MNKYLLLDKEQLALEELAARTCLSLDEILSDPVLYKHLKATNMYNEIRHYVDVKIAKAKLGNAFYTKTIPGRFVVWCCEKLAKVL